MDISCLSDAELLRRVRSLARAERDAISDLVEHLSEFDKRKLYRDRGYPSMFEFCVRALHFSEAAAYRRIRAARAILLFPPVSVLLREGRLTLETIALLHPHLGESDAAALIQRAAGLRTWEVQALLANRQTEKPRRDVIRYCGPVVVNKPAPLEDIAPLLATAGATEEAPPPASSIPSAPPAQPSMPPSSVSLRPRNIRVTFSADSDFYKLMLRAQALLRHKYPDGRLEGVLKDALIALLRRKDRGFGWRQ